MANQFILFNQFKVGMSAIKNHVQETTVYDDDIVDVTGTTSLVPDVNLKHGLVRKKWLKRHEWIILLDQTAASNVSSNDILGIIADFLIGHLFVPQVGASTVLDDGYTCGWLNPVYKRGPYVFVYSQSRVTNYVFFYIEF